MTPKEVVYINYFDKIDMPRVRALMGLCTKILGQFTPKTLYFMFATPGGEVAAGIALHNFLKALPCKIIMHNMGAVNSIGNVIFLAGEERYANPGSSFLFHGVEIGFQKDSSLTLQKLEEVSSNLREDQNKIAGIVAAHTQITKEEIAALFAQGDTKPAEFGLNKGLISKIEELRLKPDDVILSVDFNPQR